VIKPSELPDIFLGASKNVNVTGCFLCIKAALRRMLAQGGGGGNLALKAGGSVAPPR
jgi:hypothetical protein